MKGNQAYVVGVTVRYKYTEASLEEAVMEKVRKYQHLQKQIHELTNAATHCAYRFKVSHL